MSPMQPNVIRPLVVCLFLYQGKILVAEGRDNVKQQIFYRPVGGAVEFGERSSQALQREVREELFADITCEHFLGVLENIFTYRRSRGHEIVFVYDARFVDATIYKRPFLTARGDGGKTIQVLWKSLEDFRAQRSILYPDGLLDLIVKK